MNRCSQIGRDVNDQTSPRIVVAHMIHGCRTLGPGRRTVVWVRGCSRRCPDCIASSVRDDGPALLLDPAEFVACVLATEDEGVTFSGGEPFDQAPAVAEAASALCASGRSVMVYSGRTLVELQDDPDPSVAALLSVTDILVDGPFETARQRDLLWRGSSNQRIHLLSSRYRGIAIRNDQPGVGVEVRLDAEGRLFWAGVPPVGFVANMRRAADERGVILSTDGGVWA